MSEPADFARPDYLDWHQLQGDWYFTSRSDVGMFAHNLENVETVLAHGGKLDVTVDIGAHVGFTAVPCARRGAAVWAFECNPWAFGALCAGVMRNGVATLVRPLQLAVMPRPVRLVSVRSSAAVSGMAGTCQALDQPVVGVAATIDFETILGLVGGHIDYLKLDIEGGEHELLPSIPQAAWDAVDWFHLETHDVSQEKWHAGATNIDWEKLVRGVGFERVTPALWRMKRPEVA